MVNKTDPDLTIHVFTTEIIQFHKKGLWIELWLRLWCLTPLQQYFSHIMAVNFIGGGNQSPVEKTTDLSQVTDKLDHIMVYRL